MKSFLTGKNWKVLSLFLISTVLGSILLFNRFNSHLNNNFVHLSSKKIDDLKMERIEIFEEKEFLTNKLNSLLSYQEKYGKIIPSIDWEKINQTLRPFLREYLEKLFLKKGWNFQEMSGKVYFDIKNREIELLVMWKKSIYESSFTSYDRFKLSLNQLLF